jgi:hypothetical protein
MAAKNKKPKVYADELLKEWYGSDYGSGIPG